MYIKIHIQTLNDEYEQQLDKLQKLNYDDTLNEYSQSYNTAKQRGAEIQLQLHSASNERDELESILKSEQNEYEIRLLHTRNDNNIEIVNLQSQVEFDLSSVSDLHKHYPLALNNEFNDIRKHHTKMNTMYKTLLSNNKPSATQLNELLIILNQIRRNVDVRRKQVKNNELNARVNNTGTNNNNNNKRTKFSHIQHNDSNDNLQNNTNEWDSDVEDVEFDHQHNKSNSSTHTKQYTTNHTIAATETVPGCSRLRKSLDMTQSIDHALITDHMLSDDSIEHKDKLNSPNDELYY